MKVDLKCIGLSGYETIDQKHKLINEIVNTPSNSKEIKHKNNKYVEKIRSYKKNMGVIVRGELDDSNKFLVKDFVPYVFSEKIHIIDELEIEEVINKGKENEYQVNYVDPRTNLEISFALQNIVEYMETKKNNKLIYNGIQVAGLAVSGKILFPSDKNMDNVLDYTDVFAKSEDENNFQIDEFSQMNEQKRLIYDAIKDSDLYTVMDTFLVQTDVDTVYNVLGKIEDVKLVKNSETNEKIYILSLKVMGMDMEVCINKKDLFGMPSKGMRFTGTCWMQGKVVF